MLYTKNNTVQRLNNNFFSFFVGEADEGDYSEAIPCDKNADNDAESDEEEYYEYNSYVNVGHHDYINVPDCLDNHKKEQEDEDEEEDDYGVPPVPPPKDYLSEPPVRRSGATTPPPPPIRKESDNNNNKKIVFQKTKSRENIDGFTGGNDVTTQGITYENHNIKGKPPKKTKSAEALDREWKEQEKKTPMQKAKRNEKLEKPKLNFKDRSKSNEQLDAINAELSQVISQTRSENNLAPSKPQRQGLHSPQEKPLKPVVAIKPQIGSSPKPSPKPKPRFASKIAMLESAANS